MSSKYKAYAEYKDSGVEWLGEIPGHWDVLPIKYLSKSIGTGGTPKHESSFTDEQELNWFTPSDFSNHMNLTVSSKYVTTESVNSGDAKVFASGSVAVIGIGATLGKVSYCPTVFSCNQQINVVTPGNNVSGKYLVFALSVQTEQMKQVSNASTIGIMNQEKMKNLLICSPPLKEIDHIDTFLDHETAKIDTLIEEQKTLIRLLQEKRQAVISHAVTKGLNPDAPMKDSGVEWLGEVPEHWVVRRLKHVASHQAGIPKGKDLTGKVTIEVPMLRVANVQDGYLKLDDVHNIHIEPNQLERFVLKKGDVLMNEGGDNDKLGRGAVWSGEIEPCIHQNHVHAIRPRDIEPEWLEILIASSYAKFHFYRVAKQSTNLASISSSNIKETPLVIPPKEERMAIMHYLRGVMRKYDAMETHGEKQIQLLQERRTALISAAVTGKIDVRDWTPPAPQQEQQQEMALCN